MGYIFIVVAAVILIPLVFVLFTSWGGGMKRTPKDEGVMHNGPSSDQPTPKAGNTNQTSTSQAKKIPPG